MTRGRKKDFDEQEALASMTKVFWRKGYDGASYEDLVKGTGVQRYGLYSAFGDKRSAFLYCINFYVNNMVKQFTAPMRAKNAGVQEVKDYLDTISSSLCEKNTLGCFACNSINEKVTDEDKEIKKAIDSMFVMLKDSLKHALSNAKKKGEVSKSLNVNKTVNIMIGTMTGATIMSRANMEKQIIVDLIENCKEKLAK